MTNNKSNAPIFIDDEHGFGRCMIVCGPWTAEYKNIILEKSIRCLRFSQDMGWSDESIQFLTELPPQTITSIEIYSQKISDVSAISHFSTIEKIGLQTKKTVGFTSSSFQNLKYLAYSWVSGGIFDIFSETLSVLKIDKYPFTDLSEIPSSKSLTKLLIGSKNLTTLAGVGRFLNLKSISILDARQLYDICDLSKISKLYDLALDGAAKINDISPISNLENLRCLVINNCSGINSIHPIKDIKGIERLEITGNTTILDGDLSIINHMLFLKKLQLSPRKNYSPKASVLLKSINYTP